MCLLLCPTVSVLVSCSKLSLVSFSPLVELFCFASCFGTLNLLAWSIALGVSFGSYNISSVAKG
ncbi:hypothetical protein J4Q44_G00203830 [Coregonus suidteri]|uniref:Uncharacterized protein n=1 Tax=Coregonus suidteri TaxID=861788 RepID=A0AAN8LM44_9TELE